MVVDALLEAEPKLRLLDYIHDAENVNFKTSPSALDLSPLAHVSSGIMLNTWNSLYAPYHL